MKIKQEEAQQICRLILERLKEKKLVILKAPQDKVDEALRQTFLHNMREEEEIDQRARQILEENMEANPELDRHKMFLLIKRKIAKERGFVL